MTYAHITLNEIKEIAVAFNGIWLSIFAAVVTIDPKFAVDTANKVLANVNDPTIAVPVVYEDGGQFIIAYTSHGGKKYYFRINSEDYFDQEFTFPSDSSLREKFEGIHKRYEMNVSK